MLLGSNNNTMAQVKALLCAVLCIVLRGFRGITSKRGPKLTHKMFLTFIVKCKLLFRLFFFFLKFPFTTRICI